MLRRISSSPPTVCGISALHRRSSALFGDSSSSPSSSLMMSAFSASSISAAKKRRHQQQQILLQQKKKQKEMEFERQKQEEMRQQQLEEETKLFDLRIHQEEMAAYRQHELENTLELVEEDDSAVKVLVEAARSQKQKMLAREEAEEKGGKKSDSHREQEEQDDEDDGLDEMPFLPSPAPDTLMVQFCDHMQHDQGVKRHAVTITFGSDGFKLANMCKEVRKDLKSQLATSYWQMNQTQERSAFFVCTRISHGTADLLITSMTQRVINYVERFGYKLETNSVTLSPDVQHTSVRMLYHYFIFRRTAESKLLEAKWREEERLSKMEEILEEEEESEEQVNRSNNNNAKKNETDDGDQDGDDDDELVDNNDEEYVKGQPEFKNFEAPKVGPQEPAPNSKKVSHDQKVEKIWKN